MPSEQTTIVDTENQFEWDQITSTFNDSNILTNRLTRFDNGNTTEEHFDGVTGALDVVIEQDLADEESWVQILTSYDNLGTATQSTSFDNGVTREDRIQPALTEDVPAYLSSRHEYDDGEAFGWATRSYNYDFSGNLLNSSVHLDNGLSEGRTYQEGLLTSKIRRDTNDIFAWETIETRYDRDGYVEDREIVYDDGIEQYMAFFDGHLFYVSQSDNLNEVGDSPADGGVKNWETTETFYDRDGNVDSRNFFYDDGTVKYMAFDSGQLNGVYQGDNLDEFGDSPADGGAKNWETIHTYYDRGGNVVDREIVYDDGIFKAMAFHDSQVFYVYQDDNLDEFGDSPADGGVKNWETIQSFYDGDGNIQFKVTVYDNGSIDRTYFENCIP